MSRVPSGVREGLPSPPAFDPGPPTMDPLAPFVPPPEGASPPPSAGTAAPCPEGDVSVGVGFEVLVPQVIALTIFAIILIGIAILRFRKRLD